LTTPRLLHALRLTDSPERASYSLEDSTGRRFTVEVSLLGLGANPQWIFARDTSPSASPLYLRNQADFYWYVYDPGSQVLYLQYNRSLNKPSQSFAQFCQELFAFADANPISRFIVDIRLNNGGDFNVNRPLIEGLRARPALTQPGRLFVIIGRRTFSAAMMCAVDLLTNFNAVLVGEPTGGNTNHYGDNRQFTLPNSGISINYATVFHQLTEPRTQGQPLQPQILAELSFTDYRANRDPAMQVMSIANALEQRESQSAEVRVRKAKTGASCSGAAPLRYMDCMSQ
jgi:C-terminal processing protease CtpA/Prc